jgi:hypothetical protein
MVSLRELLDFDSRYQGDWKCGAEALTGEQGKDLDIVPGRSFYQAPAKRTDTPSRVV